MKRVIAILVMLTACLQGISQNLAETLAKMPPSRIVFSEKTYNRSGQETGSATGSVKVQYPCFSLTYGTLEICGDGKTVWYLDTADNEVTISGGNALQSIVSDKSIKFDAQSKTISIPTPDGGRRDFSIIFVEELESRWPESHFMMDVSALGTDTIVTDLR